LRTIEELNKAGIQVGVMLGPMIPGLNEHEMPGIIKSATDAGATFSAYTFIRLNGVIKELFHDWLYKNFPDRADKVWHLIESGHGGKVNDSRFGVRMSGEGNIAKMIADQYHTYTKKFGLQHERLGLDCSLFQRPGEQGRLF
jgi:DNA repair photolyase